MAGRIEKYRQEELKNEEDSEDTDDDDDDTDLAEELLPDEVCIL